MKKNETLNMKDVPNFESVAHLSRIALAIMLFLFAGNAHSQSLSLFDVDATNFPTIKAKFFAFDKEGNQITNLSPSSFELNENGKGRALTIVSCPEPQPPQALSSVLTIDVSGSMRSGNINLAKEAARAWVEGLPLGKSECAISSFDNNNYLNQDFTIDKNKLLTAINNLQSWGGTNYDAALINPLSGGLIVTKNGKHKLVIVFLSDGLPNQEPNTSKIIQEAKQQNVIIYGVTLGMTCPQNIKDITTQTDGQWFENVTTVEQARKVYQQILQTAQGGEPCLIEWQSGIACTAGITNVELRITSLNITANTSYQSPNTAVAKLEFEPSSIKFMDPEVGVKTEQKVTVTARNSNFTITNITSNNAGFDITPKSFVLNAGQSKELTVSYLPADSGYNSCKFDIENDICPSKYYASGGWKNTKPTIRTIKLIHPNGGEVFVAGNDTVITWEGVSPDEPVRLEYRTDDNKPWILVVDSVKGLSYNWKVPKNPSDQCLARVTANAKHLLFCNNPDVEICENLWMGCNLDVDRYRNGELIRYAETNEEWIDAGNKKEGAWCYYNNDPANSEIYGKLYNWYAVNNPRGLAPKGWHVPTDEEWTEFENCLGGSSIAGGKLKSIGTIEGVNGLWLSPNTGATNETGFSALPGGYRYSSGDYRNISYNGYCWSYTQDNNAGAWGRSLYYGYAYVYRGSYNKVYGFSVRCVRD